MESQTALYIQGTHILDSRRRDLAPEAGVDAVGFAAAAVRGIDQDARTVEAVVSSGEVDRWGEIVDPKAFDRETINAFMANPVMLASHQHRGVAAGEPGVIGHWLSLKREGDVVVGVAKFATTDLAEKYWQLYLAGSMKAFSIGFLPRAWEMREEPTSRRDVGVAIVCGT